MRDLAPAVASAKAEEKKRGLRGRRKRKEAQPQKPAVAAGSKRSSPEPGMENQDLSFMQSLSSRLDAYSITAEDSVPVSVEPEKAPEETDDAESEFEPKSGFEY